MNNFELISRALSYNNSEINAVKSVNDTLSKSLQKKQDKIIELNTDALSGLKFDGLVTSPEIETTALLGLFGFDSILALNAAIPTFDNKIFVLRPTLEGFSIGNTVYTITTCTPSIGKVVPYGSTNVLMLTFLFNTVNTQICTMTLYLHGIHGGEVSGRISVENIVYDISVLQSSVSVLKEKSVEKDELITTLEDYSTTGHTHTEFTTLQENIDKVDNKLFVGTQEEYDVAYAEGKIAVGALVIILDDEDTASVAILGQGKLGTLILGNNGQ